MIDWFDYLRFLVVLMLGLLAISLAVIWLGPSASRRQRGFRILASFLAVSLVAAGGEAISWLWPTRHLMDNPWYMSTQRALGVDRDLRFVRPSGIEWMGWSRGDLAVLSNRPDPAARKVRFVTDYQGFRNEADVRQADVVFVGDSFTEAGNVPEEETFARRVGTARGVSVRNLGVAGYTTEPQRIVLERYGLPMGPRAVVWQIAESNDLEESVVFFDWKRAGRPDFRTEPQQQPSRAEAWARRSPIYRFYRQLREPEPWPLGGRFVDAAGRGHDVLFLPVLPGAAHSPRGHPGWPLMAAAVREGATALRERKIELVVLLIPMKLRVLADAVSFWPPRLPGARRAPLPAPGLEDWDLAPESTLARSLHALCSELGVVFVDSTEALRVASSDGRLVYLPFDSHLSSEGHAVVGELLAESLSPAMATP